MTESTQPDAAEAPPSEAVTVNAAAEVEFVPVDATATTTKLSGKAKGTEPRTPNTPQTAEPTCPTCSGPLQRYIGDNPHKRDTGFCSTCGLRHRLEA